MKPKRILFRLFFLALLIFGLFFTGLFFAGLYLPTFLKSSLFPLAGRRLAIEDVTIEGGGIGVTTAYIHDLRAGKKTEAFLTVEAIRLAYSPGGLFRRHLKKITVVGPTLRCIYADKKLTFTGLDLSGSRARDAALEKKAPSSFSLPTVTIDEIDIRQAVIICRFNGKLYRLPFNLNLSVAALSESPGAQLMAKWTAKDIDIGHLAQLIDFGDVGRLKGRLDLNGYALFERSPFRFVSMSGHMDILLAPIKWNSAVSIQTSAPIGAKMQFGAKSGPESEWHFLLSSLSPENLKPAARTVSLVFGDLISSATLSQMKISGRGQNLSAVIRLETRLADITSRNPRMHAAMPQADITGEADISLLTEAEMAKVTLAASGSDLDITQAATRLSISGASLHGRLGVDGNGSITADGMVKVKDGHMVDPSSQIKIKGIDIQLPVKWPVEASPRQGAITIRQAQFKELNLGPIKASIGQDRSGFVFGGKYTHGAIPGLSLLYSGTLPIFGPSGYASKIQFETSYAGQNTEIRIDEIFPAAEGMVLNGKIDLHGSLQWEKGGLSGFATTSLQNGRLKIKDNIEIEGLNATCDWPDLFRLQSAPGQKLRFNRVSMGDIILDSGEIDFMIESPDSLFIEKSTFKWCGGHVYTHAVRVSPKRQDYKLILYCDRLKLSELLKQVGTFHADGSGAVYGRIPIRLHNKNISFDDAFLYSTPGNGGTIHLTGTEVLTAGIPPGTVHHTQIELAREALKDYTYEWVKLHLTSQEDTLLFKMQFDGKPANRLPFVYSKDLGGFVKARTAKEGSLFQGIRLDINFNLPLNKILFYGNKLK